MTAFAKSLGLIAGTYREVIGLRHDEGHRVMKALTNARFRWDRAKKQEVERTPPRLVVVPLSKAKVTKADVMRFWLGPTGRMDAGVQPQGFDLGLEPHEGNCDFCFLKGRGLRKRLIRDVPGVAVWWDQQEQRWGQWFDKRDDVRDLIAEVHKAPELFDVPDDENDEHDAECGLHCAPMEIA